MTPAGKLALLASLYLAQGMPYGFFSQFLPAMLREQGVSLEGVGLASLLALPWALKFAWAPLVDRHGSSRFGHRRSWIVPLQLLTVVTLLALSLVEPTVDLQAMLLGVLVLNFLASTQDIATDGLAVTILAPQERGLGNGVQVAAYRLGMILCGGVLLILYPWLGWARVCQCMAGAIALTTLPIAGFREPPPEEQERPGLAVFAEFFRRPGMGSWLLAIAAFKLGEAFGVGMLRPFFIDVGLSLSDIGWLTGTAGFIASLVGAMVGGAFVASYGRWRCLFVFAAVQALAVASYAIAAAGWRDGWVLYALCTFEHFASGMATAALFTMMMDASRPRTAGTDYTIQASVVVLATGVGASLSGFSAARFGYTDHFLIAAGMCVLGALPAVLHWRRVRRGETELANLP
ncbi:MFS transporter [Nannocystis sp. SCPEA4]|uniref:MFS transporter n=1 Tax=Nannocystis sp. SCPEA4 TaxID=2996787 RepID=UPI00226F7B08|nr:MFS transporter [Nannocystis sp. SCPEA4]MCY1055900.1 MFS transporter [Nannocystis sp. SCPEA4]